MNGKSFIFKLIANWPAKTLALMMALFLYIFQQMNEMTSIRVDIPLTYNENASLVMTAPLPDKVRLALSGTSADIGRVREQDITASVDLTAYTKPGIYSAPVALRNAEGAKSLDLLNVTVTPSEVKLTLDRHSGKYIPVEPAFKGEVAPGYELTRYTSIPREIYVEGPAGLVGKIRAVSTELIDITGLNADLVRNTTIADLGTSVKTHDRAVQLSVFIKSIDEIREYTELPVSVRRLDPRFVTGPIDILGGIEARGNLRAIASYQPDEQTLTLDCSQITEAGVFILPVLTRLPDTITLLRHTPETVTIRVVNAP